MSKKKTIAKSIATIVGYSAWAMVAFIGAQLLIAGIWTLMRLAGVDASGINTAVFSMILSIIIYSLTLFIAIGVPRYVFKLRTSLKDLGLQRFVEWKDFLWLGGGLLAYFVVTFIISSLARIFLPFIDFDEVQQTGYESIVSSWEYVVAFLAIVVVAPVAEEILFRGYLFGKLKSNGVKLWISIVVTSLLFAVAHFQGNVGVDVFALSIVLCLLRVYSGSLWPAIMLHMAKNGIAFYFLFINTSFLSTIGG